MFHVKPLKEEQNAPLIISLLSEICERKANPTNNISGIFQPCFSDLFKQIKPKGIYNSKMKANSLLHFCFPNLKNENNRFQKNI